MFLKFAQKIIMNQIRRAYLLIVFLFFPLISFAQTSTTLFDIMDLISETVDSLVGIALGVGLLVFIWGLIKFMFALGQGNEPGIAAGKQLMMWGIVAMFVMVAIWGIVKLITSITGIETGGEIDVPTLKI
jgi:hypothetical protein